MCVTQTDQTVDKESVDMESVQVVNERLSDLFGTKLIHWTADKYGRAVSYTEVQRANKFDVIVNGGGTFIHSSHWIDALFL